MTEKVYATIHSIVDEAKGPSYSVRRLYDEIIKQGRNVVLVDADFQLGVSLPSFSMSFLPGYGPAKLGRSPDMYRYLKKEATNGSITLLHNHGLWMMPNVYPGWIAKRYKIPLITSPRGTFAPAAWNSGSKIKKLFWPLLQKPALDKTVCFHATSYSEYLDIRRMGYKQPVAIIPNGIDVPELSITQLDSSSDMKTLLFLGRIHPIKGIDMLLYAWSTLQHEFQNWQLKIIGPDNNNYLATLKEIANRLKLQRVIFGGAIYGDRKWREYHDTDLYVLPTHSENFAMSVAESLAMATPVVVTKGAPWSEVETSNSGRWVEINSDAILVGLREMMQKPTDELQRMGLNGANLMISRYSWSGIANNMIKLYHWVLHGGDVPAFVRLD